MEKRNPFRKAMKNVYSHKKLKTLRKKSAELNTNRDIVKYSKFWEAVKKTRLPISK